MKKKSPALTMAVLLSCSTMLMPYYAYADSVDFEAGDTAEESNHNENLWKIDLPDQAGDKTFAIMDVYNKTNDPDGYEEEEPKLDENGEPIEDTDGNEVTKIVHYDYRDFFPGEKPALNNSMKYINDMIAFAKEEAPLIKLELKPEKDDNAAAESNTAFLLDDKGKLTSLISGTELAEVIQNGYTPSGKYAAELEIDDATDAWVFDKFPSLPSNGTDSDYYGTVTHEMFHALGLYGNVSISDNKQNIGVNFEGEASDGNKISQLVLNKYEIGLRDAFGRVSYRGLNSNEFIDYDNTPLTPNAGAYLVENGISLVGREIAPITYKEYEQFFDEQGNLLSDQLESNKFYILHDPAMSENSEADEAAEDEESITIGPNGGAYFTGENVMEVLKVNNRVAQILPADGGHDIAVEGIPINCYEGYEGTESVPELSHSELQNSLMSHQNYRNWCTFMEAELALLQDLGYSIDRSKYFGESIYNSGTVNDDDSIEYFTYTNNTSFDSTQQHGIGLHVYGSYVNVTQDAELKPTGAYSMGIRVDGVGNKLNIANNVSANGEGGNALAVTYGKNHEITLAGGASLQATGKNGVAARFDFGSNELGDKVEYRGSYIQTVYMSAAEAGKEASNRRWVMRQEDYMPDAIKGELVKKFNVNGKLEGKDAAIYISPNAWVKNINISSSAEIKGRIISEWNPREIIYQNGDGKILAPVLPEGEAGLTNLNFNDYNKDFTNDIFGENSIILNVNSGSLTTKDATYVYGLNVATVAEYTNGVGEQNGEPVPGVLNVADSIKIDGRFTNKGKMQTWFDEDGSTVTITGSGNAKLTEGDSAKLLLIANRGLYGDTTNVNYFTEDSLNVDSVDISKIEVYTPNDSAILKFKVELKDNADVKKGFEIIASRGYEQYAGSNAGAQQIAAQLADKANELADKNEDEFSANDKTWKALLEAMEFNDTTGATAQRTLKELNPNVYNSNAQAVLQMHGTFNNMLSLSSIDGLGMHARPAARSSGGRGPAPSDTPKYNSWRNIVMPFSSYTDQHNGSNSYTNHNSGALGGMERTLENGLTMGYHAAVNHQSTSSGSQRVKGEGLYFGTQASYAPASWNGWRVFGSARVGIEQMRSRRSLSVIPASMEADWTGYSSSLRLGTALTKEHGVCKSGPFAALDYSFMHRPSVSETGNGITAQLASENYDSLRTQLGYQLSTAPKGLDNYDATKWQAHAAIAWNHELTSDNGSNSFALAGLPQTMSEQTADYGRDSLSLMGGITFQTPKKLDVTLSLGSDIYRQGGSAIYGKVALEWKF